MLNLKEKFQKNKKSYLQFVGIFILLLLAVFLLWFNNNRSVQALPALVGSVYFDGEYKIEDGEWHTEKCKFDIAMNGDVAAVAISRKEVSIKICAPCEKVTEDSDISRIETVSLDGEEYRILIKNETSNSLKVFSDIKI